MAPPAPEVSFVTAWVSLTRQPGMLRLLAIIAFGTAGFGMADVLLEPYGGQVLAMTVAQTTRLTVFLALGSLIGFTLASRWLGRGARPMDVAIYGAGMGVPAFGLIVLAAILVSVPLLIIATLLAGFGAGLFGHGTLTATMRAARRDQIGLSLGAWGAVQATAAGTAIAIGGAVRDMVLASEGAGASASTPYTVVFGIEVGLLVLALLLALPFWGKARLGESADPLPDPTLDETAAQIAKVRYADGRTG
jgi:MFS transporter, BCD family, chlorophyll transporter